MRVTGPTLLGLFFMSKTTDTILKRKSASYDYLSTKRAQWDTWEQLFHGELRSAITNKTKSQVFDPKLATLLIERSYRVMAQLHTGKVKAISKNDPGASALMNLTLDKYIIPNANSQFDFLTKLRMVDLYSNIYGKFYGMVDWTVNGKNGYIGPDMWLLNMRDVFPQVGSVSVQDSDEVIIRTWKPKSFFEGLKGSKKKSVKGYKNIPKILGKMEDTSGDKSSRDAESEGQRESKEYPTAQPTPNDGFYEVLSQYEGDKWTDMVAGGINEVFREIDNPHENGELPVIEKHSIPLLDDMNGMGDMERGESMQKVVNSVWNMYLDGVKMSIFPPLMVNKDNIASMSSIKWGPSRKWLVRNQINNAIAPVPLSPQGIATFNNTYQAATGSLLNLVGTTDTAVNKDTEASFGRTPQALKMQQARENTRDNADRFYMDQFTSNVIKKMVNLMSIKADGSTQIRMFQDEIEQLAEDYPEVKEMYDEKTGKLNINKKKMGSVLYDYEIVEGSSFSVDEDMQMKNLTSMIEMLTKNPQLIQEAQQRGIDINMGEMIKRVISKSGIQDWDKIVTEMKDEDKADAVLENDMAQFTQAIEQMQGIGQVPPQQAGQQPLPQGGPVGR